MKIIQADKSRKLLIIDNLMSEYKNVIGIFHQRMSSLAYANYSYFTIFFR